MAYKCPRSPEGGSVIRWMTLACSAEIKLRFDYSLRACMVEILAILPKPDSKLSQQGRRGTTTASVPVSDPLTRDNVLESCRGYEDQLSAGLRMTVITDVHTRARHSVWNVMVWAAPVAASAARVAPPHPRYGKLLWADNLRTLNA